MPALRSLLAVALVPALCLASCGESNAPRSGDDGTRADTLAPVVSAHPAPGTYGAPIDVVLVASEPSVVRFTADGSDPTEASEPFTAPIPVAVDATLRFFAVDLAGNAGTVQEARYVIDTVAAEGEGEGEGEGEEPEPEPGRVVADPAAGIFGAVDVGGRKDLSVTLSVEGGGAVGLAALRVEGDRAGEGAEDFAIVEGGEPASLSPREGLAATLSFVPSVEGVRVAVLVAAAADGGEILARVPLVGEGRAPDRRVGARAEPARLDLGRVDVGGVAGPAAVRVENTGTQALESLAVALDGAAGFAWAEPEADGCEAAGRLEPGGSCGLQVRYAAERPGEAAGVLTVSFDDAPAVHVILVAEAAADEPVPAELVASVEGGVLDFGARDAPVEREVTLFNRGGQPTGELLAVVDGDGFWVGDDGCTGEGVAPDAACTVAVRFAPPSDGPFEGRLRVWGANPVTLTLTGEGRGVRAGALSAAPVRLDFGDAGPGVDAVRALTVSNPGAQPLAGLSWRIDGDDPGAFSAAPGGDQPCVEGGAVAPGPGCGLAVTFAPAAGGAARATLVISAAGVGDAASVALEGRGVGFDAAALVASPALADFGEVGEPTSLAVTVRNAGDLPTASLRVRVEGDGFGAEPPGDDGCAGLVLPAGAGCGVTVRFEPVADGARQGRLVVGDGAAEVVVPLVAVGIGFGPPRLAVDPQEHDFGEVERLEATPPMTITVRNEGDLSAKGLTWWVDGDADFTLGPAPDGGCEDGRALRGHDQCLLHAVFAPMGPGFRGATLRLVFDEAPAPVDVPLRGLGVGFLPPDLALVPGPDGAFGEAHDPAERIFAVTNLGELPTASLEVRLRGGGGFSIEEGADGCAGRTLAGGVTCGVAVTFAPVANGDQAATLTFTAGEQAVVVDLEGTGVDWLPTDLVADPGSVDFGNIGDAASSDPATITVRNDGEVPLTGLSIELAGDDPDAFEIDGDVAGACLVGDDLGGGGQCTVTVSLVPGDADGALAATLTVSGPEDSVDVTLEGSAGVVWQGAGASWTASGHSFGRFTWAQAGIGNNGRANAMAFCEGRGGTLARPDSQAEWDAIHDNLPQDSQGYWIDGHNNFVCGTATPGNPKPYQYGDMYCPTGTPLLYTGCNCTNNEQGLVAYRHSGGGPFDGCQGSGGMAAGYLGVMDENVGYAHANIVGFVCQG